MNSEKPGKVCKKCFFQYYDKKEKFCPNCGEPLREMVYQDSTDIIMKTLPEDNLIGHGLHLRCGGRVDAVEDSFGGALFVCRACYLRVKLYK